MPYWSCPAGNFGRLVDPITASVRRLLCAVPLAVSLSTGPAAVPAIAQEQGGSRCAGIEAPLARLACYDNVFRPPAAPAGPAESEWRISSATSPVSGWNNIVLEVESRETVPIDFGTAQRGKLQIRCIDNVTSVRFWFGGNYMSDFGEYAQVSYRIDNRARQTFEADATGDNLYVGLFAGAAAIPFVRQLFGAGDLSISARPINESDTPVTMQFNVTGVAEEIRPLRESCNW